jgi:hypothetical protein
MQVFEGEHDRLRSSARQEQGCHRRQLPPSQFVGREFRHTVLGQRDADQRREQGHVFRCVQTDQPQGILEFGESSFVGRVDVAEAHPSPFRDGMHRRILQQLRGPPLDPGMRRLAEPDAKLLDQPRLAQARLADDERELTLALASALPAPAEEIELLLASDERGQGARAAAPAAAASANDAIERHWLRHAFELMRAAVLSDK